MNRIGLQKYRIKPVCIGQPHTWQVSTGLSVSEKVVLHASADRILMKEWFCSTSLICQSQAVCQQLTVNTTASTLSLEEFVIVQPVNWWIFIQSHVNWYRRDLWNVVNIYRAVLISFQIRMKTGKLVSEIEFNVDKSE